ncbi:MAG: helix-turn-helix transcriptional regulator [Bacteroidota bacterium]
MSIANRVQAVIEDKGLKNSDFAKLTGYESSNLGHFLRGKTKKPSIDLAIGIARAFPEVNLYWLLLGEGEMYRPASEVIAETVNGLHPDSESEDYRALADNQKQLLEILQAQRSQYERIIINNLPDLAEQLGLG